MRRGILLQSLEADKSDVEERVRALQADMLELGEGGSGADGKNGSEALQKELLRVLTDLAQASTEVPCI